MAELVKTRHARLAVERRGIGRTELRAAVFYPDTVEKGKGYKMEKRSAAGVVAIIYPTRRKLLLITAYREGEKDCAERSTKGAPGG
ncbi:DUF4258 domain-containing protein [Parvularcula sp. ZS-1/3]|uniref:DUF4258 domain-containing protein n=1 Tax=Parvularcula mediterranea TaxID=2732508 RepID=A0A7Y3RP26_9PROT|nr:DUF4258 domain-containing protein [Parvularcula mediterranea]NNU17613.1 DUF4258 domain-containing protein [Parvularcula mediterranea]